MPIVITIEMNNPRDTFSSAVAGGSLVGAPTSFEQGSVQIRQVHARDRGQLMSPSMDGSKGYSLPVIFYQNQIDIPITSVDAAGRTQVTLTGLRSGDMTHLIAWLTDDADTAPDTSAPFARNPFNFKSIKSPSILYNGTVYYTAQNEAAQLWDVVSTDVFSSVPNLVLGPAAGGVIPLNAATPVNSTWLSVPFAQIFEQISATHTMVHGLPISNAVVNMSLTVPDPAASHTLHVVYVYNSVLFVSRGNAEYVF
jgi:hypothetical protein